MDGDQNLNVLWLQSVTSGRSFFSLLYSNNAHTKKKKSHYGSFLGGPLSLLENLNLAYQVLDIFQRSVLNVEH